MADKKISQLPASSSVVATSLVPQVVDPSGTAVTEAATWAQVRDYVFGDGNAALDGALTVTKDTGVQLTLVYDGTPGADAYLSSGTGGLTIAPVGAYYDKNLLLGYRVHVADESGSYSVTDTAFLQLPPSTTGVASLRIPHGTAPSSPVNGDIWTTSAGMYARINGVTVGPFLASAVSGALSVAGAHTDSGAGLVGQISWDGFATGAGGGVVMFGGTGTLRASQNNESMYGMRFTNWTFDPNGYTGTVAYGIRMSVGGAATNYALYLDSGQNYLGGVTGIGVATSSTTRLVLAASTTGVSSLRIPHGTAPSAPVNGDIWTTTAGVFARINGTTVQLATV